jgi:DNA-binding CsgD family transcriptional regulator
MPKASTADQVIQEAYDCVVEQDGWNQLLASYARLVDADSGVIYLRRNAGDAGTLIASLNYDASSRLTKYLAYYDVRDPKRAIYRGLPESEVRAVGDFAFSSDYRETEFYRDWARLQGYGDMLGAHVVRTPKLYAWFALRREERRGTFMPAQVRVADRVAPHLTRAIKLQVRLEQESGKAASLREAVEMLGFGVVIVAGDGKVLLANRSADAILKAADGLQSHRGQLACARPQETSALQHAIRARTRAGAASDLFISRGNGRRPLTVHVAPISSLSAWSDLTPATGVAAVFLIDPTSSAANIDGFAAAYALTAAEKRVLHEIVACGGLVRAAETLRVAVPTARTHLQHIFAKTCTNNQADLVQLVAGSSLRLRDS